MDQTILVPWEWAGLQVSIHLTTGTSAGTSLLAAPLTVAGSVPSQAANKVAKVLGRTTVHARLTLPRALHKSVKCLNRSWVRPAPVAVVPQELTMGTTVVVVGICMMFRGVPFKTNKLTLAALS